MKVIDLLIGIANKKYNELKTKFVFDEKQYNFVEFSNVFVINSDTLNWEVEIIEEDKKIEKLKIEQDTPNSNFYIKDENGTKCGLTKHSKIIVDKINEIIDYINKEK